MPNMAVGSTPGSQGAPGASLWERGLEFIHEYSLGVFALLFLFVAGSGVQVASVYLSSHIPSIPLAVSSIHIPAVPHQGPNMTVASNQLAASLQHLASQPLSLIIDGKTVPVSPEAITSWLQVVNDKTKSVSYIHVNAAAIAATMTDMTKPFLKAPVNPITITRADGSTSVIGNGKNGVSLGDSSQLQKQLAQNLLGAKGMQLNIPLQSLPFQAVSAATVDKIIEVNIVSKEMWVYDKGVMTRSFLISAGAPATPTPIGQYQIYQKLAVQDMKGFNANGTKYFQPHVHWINYFLPGGYAVHGVYWHPLSWFGANNSSHGCVGLSDSDAEWVYDWAPIGTTVITHT